MGVQLNIKHPEARRLAEELAAATGMSLTEAVTSALRNSLQHAKRQDAGTQHRFREREAAFYRMIEGSRGHWQDDLASLDHADMLYDDHGLPG